MPRWMTPDETAAALNTSKESLLTWARSGRIPATRLSRKQIRFDLDAILAALSKPAPAAEPAKLTVD